MKPVPKITFWQQVGIALRAYPEAVRFIGKHKLSWYFIFPAIFNVLLFLLGWDVKGRLFDKARNWLFEYITFENLDFWGSEYLDEVLGSVLWVLISVIFFIVFAFFAGYVVVVLLSPVLAYLSEKTEKIITGNDYPFHFGQFLKDIGRGILIATRNMSIEIIFTVVLFIFSFVPVIGWLGPVILFFISSYFYGFSFIDYINERKKRTIRKSVLYMRIYKGVAIANGCIFALTLFIPFCGVSISSFMAIISVVAASLAIDKLTVEKH